MQHQVNLKLWELLSCSHKTFCENLWRCLEVATSQSRKRDTFGTVGRNFLQTADEKTSQILEHRCGSVIKKKSKSIKEAQSTPKA